MVSLLHEAVVLLFRNRPSLGPELLRDTLHVPVTEFAEVRIADAGLNEIVPTEYRADLVLHLLQHGANAPAAAVVVEVQLAVDADKRWTWPVYLAGLRRRLRCDVTLLVVTVDRAVGRWASSAIAMGHPGWTLTPVVLGPAMVPVVDDEATALAAPELAVLSILAHGDEPSAAAIVKPALDAVRHLDEDRARLYADLVVSAARHGAARAALEALMASGKYEYQSDFAKKYVAEGRAQGRVEGRVEGRAEAVLALLEARGLEVPASIRTHVMACTDLAKIDTWLARALTARTAAEVIGE
jgi:hypothetical protein